MGICTCSRASDELYTAVRAKLDLQHYRKIKDYVFTRILFSRMEAWVEGINMGFSLSQTPLDLKLSFVLHRSDAILFDVTWRSEADLVQLIRAIDISPPKYSANKLFQILCAKREAVKNAKWLNPECYASCDKPLEEFLAWFNEIESGGRVYIPEVLRRLRRYLLHPDVTPELWQSAISAGRVHES